MIRLISDLRLLQGRLEDCSPYMVKLRKLPFFVFFSTKLKLNYFIRFNKIIIFFFFNHWFCYEFFFLDYYVFFGGKFIKVTINRY